MQHYVDNVGFAGVITMLARKGKIVHFEQVGWQDREAQIPMAADTIFRIYSMTNQIIYSLDDALRRGEIPAFLTPVAKFLPAFAKTKVYTEQGEVDRSAPCKFAISSHSRIYLRLLENSHRRGCRRPVSNPNNSLETAINELARLPLAYQPGSKWHYSVPNRCVGAPDPGHLRAATAGFLRQRLFAPLGMEDTAFNVPAEKQNRLSAMYGHPDIDWHRHDL